MRAVASDASAALRQRKDVVIFSSRKVLRGGSQKENLAICRRVSMALTGAVARIAVRPRFFIAKGGISSHDIATPLSSRECGNGFRTGSAGGSRLGAGFRNQIFRTSLCRFTRECRQT
jgi:hypothetical protein